MEKLHQSPEGPRGPQRAPFGLSIPVASIGSCRYRMQVVRSSSIETFEKASPFLSNLLFGIWGRIRVRVQFAFRPVHSPQVDLT